MVRKGAKLAKRQIGQLNRAAAATFEEGLRVRGHVFFKLWEFNLPDVRILLDAFDSVVAPLFPIGRNGFDHAEVGFARTRHIGEPNFLSGPKREGNSDLGAVSVDVHRAGGAVDLMPVGVSPLSPQGQCQENALGATLFVSGHGRSSRV